MPVRYKRPRPPVEHATNSHQLPNKPQQFWFPGVYKFASRDTQFPHGSQSEFYQTASTLVFYELKNEKATELKSRTWNRSWFRDAAPETAVRRSNEISICTEKATNLLTAVSVTVLQSLFLMLLFDLNWKIKLRDWEWDSGVDGDPNDTGTMQCGPG